MTCERRRVSKGLACQEMNERSSCTVVSHIIAVCTTRYGVHNANCREMGGGEWVQKLDQLTQRAISILSIRLSLQSVRFPTVLMGGHYSKLGLVFLIASLARCWWTSAIAELPTSCMWFNHSSSLSTSCGWSSGYRNRSPFYLESQVTLSLLRKEWS
jgi:hypothetical protein